MVQSLSKASASQTSCGRHDGLHGSRQASIRTTVMIEGSITQKEEDAFTGDEVLLGVESDALKLVDLQQNHLDSLSISVSSPPSTPSDRPSLSATFRAPTTNFVLPLGPLVSPLFSPTKTSQTPRTLSSYRMGYWFEGVRIQPAKPSSRMGPGLLELDFSPRPISPRFPSSAAIPSPFRMQLQEDVATTPLPSGTPLTARWPGSGFRQLTSRVSNQELMAADLDGAILAG